MSLNGESMTGWALLNLPTICLVSVEIYIVQGNPVKKILKIPRKSYFLSGKFLKRVILMKWENFVLFYPDFLGGKFS
jgi:hypothetical protein